MVCGVKWRGEGLDGVCGVKWRGEELDGVWSEVER